jgi:hypothetical protein
MRTGSEEKAIDRSVGTSAASGLRRALTFFVLVVAIGLAAGTSVARAATVMVSTPAQLQAAVASAAAGDTIVLASGAYAINAPLEITVANLTITGPTTGTAGASISGSLLPSTSPNIVNIDVGASVHIVNLTLQNDPTGGDAIDVLGTLTLTNSTLQTNNSTAILSAPNSTSTITNSTFFGNDSNSGSAIDVGGTVHLLNDTIDANAQAGPGTFGIFFETAGSVTATNTLIVNNNQFGGSDCGGGTLSSPVATIDTDGTCGASSTTTVANAGLATATSLLNGGTTPTVQELAGAPSIDTGTNTGCPATDQRGLPRAASAADPCDIGAYETQPTTTKNSPTIATTLSATSIAAGGSAHDSATLTGATATAGGTVTYTAYSDSACTMNAQALSL